jgi:type II secretory pathway pseudopilin PulG
MNVKLHHVDRSRTLLRVTDPRSVQRAMKSLAAFTMIEIALALGVIGFALVAIIGVLPAGMSVQRDNRESTIVNFDANFLVDAITSGTTGLDDLTNHVIAITNYYTFYEVKSSGAIVPGATGWIGYTPSGTYGQGVSSATSVLTNGANIIALLCTPEYALSGGGFYSNYITADFRAFTGSLADQGTSQSAKSFAFAYRIFPEVVNYYASGAKAPASNPNNDAAAQYLQNNFTQIRLRFRWPIFASGGVGTSRLTFRTAVNGYSAQGVSIGPEGPVTGGWLFQQGTYLGVQ